MSTPSVSLLSGFHEYKIRDHGLSHKDYTVLPVTTTLISYLEHHPSNKGNWYLIRVPRVHLFRFPPFFQFQSSSTLLLSSRTSLRKTSVCFPGPRFFTSVGDPRSFLFLYVKRDLDTLPWVETVVELKLGHSG